MSFMLLRKFLKTKITRGQKNEDKIVGNHIKLYFYYINKEQKLSAMYLELIFTGVKTER